MRHDDTHSAAVLRGCFHHVADECVVGLGFGRRAAVEPAEGISGGVLGAPFVQRERRVRHHHVESLQVIALDELGAVQRVTPFDLGVVHPVEEHVHLAQGPRPAVYLLAV